MLDKAQPYALLVARIALGVIFLYHGTQKFLGGLGQTAATFESSGIPLAAVAAPTVATLEVVGGIALILGAALPVFGVLLTLVMLGALAFVHLANGFSVREGGYEFVLALAAGTLVVAFSGGGALAVDTFLQRRRAPAAV
ncbi:DoxX family protein [Streptosporangium sp. NPDC048865]|uniref:DoxX family protein n=1 Tax=Streptosporangium sp. NPDC048865 TaxID=3155766 RepID=UPI00341AB2A3